MQDYCLSLTGVLLSPRMAPVCICDWPAHEARQLVELENAAHLFTRLIGVLGGEIPDPINVKHCRVS